MTKEIDVYKERRKKIIDGISWFSIDFSFDGPYVRTRKRILRNLENLHDPKRTEDRNLSPTEKFSYPHVQISIFPQYATGSWVFGKIIPFSYTGVFCVEGAYQRFNSISNEEGLPQLHRGFWYNHALLSQLCKEIEGYKLLQRVRGLNKDNDREDMRALETMIAELENTPYDCYSKEPRPAYPVREVSKSEWEIVKEELYRAGKLTDGEETERLRGKNDNFDKR